ncbi:MAG: 2-dehydropantoate 2-reductase, partial [Bacteroidales bacterium]|nr:2-dehydropantoate 2-reductase [Bacteroidales bacterium]
ERGKRTEVDNYNGYIVSKGKEYGIETPVNQKLIEIIKEIEAGKRKINTRNYRFSSSKI